jgi:hypothetical protein
MEWQRSLVHVFLFSQAATLAYSAMGCPSMFQEGL